MPPLVERNMRFGVAERVGPNGEILQKPSREDLRVLARDVHASGADAIAVSTLFSFANPENERAIGRVLEELGLPLSLSHVILPEFREYERASTVVVNAYLQPVMQSYLQQLDVRLRQSRSGKAKARACSSCNRAAASHRWKRHPANPCEPCSPDPRAELSVRRRWRGSAASSASSPSTWEAPRPTSRWSTANPSPPTKPKSPACRCACPCSTFTPSAPVAARWRASMPAERCASDLNPPAPIPARSAMGAALQPTVTDANLLLGRLQPDNFLGGSFALDLERTRAVTAEWLKQQGSRMSLEQFAEGVVRVVNANMERALRVVSVERGYDPRQFALVAFGGAGGLHACELAQALGIPACHRSGHARSSLSLRNPGQRHRQGLLANRGAEPRRQDRRSRNLSRQFEALERSAAARVSATKVGGASVKFERSADLRYRGQGFELNVPFGKSLLADFHRAT